ncbi:DUF4325 domain-containing protein [Candidatus Saccharibacteria bacterium]|nr:DUF4325 domain-containing protein [Candidatus Saccharibacteria bacterium]
MNTKEQIYQILVKKGTELQASAISALGQVGDRTYVSKLLAELIKEKKVASKKVGREVFYWVIAETIILEENLKLKNLDEELIWNKLRQNSSALSSLPEKTENALYFAFTEMLNNAIDHSNSGVGYVKIWYDKEKLYFIVRDKGIGIWNSLITKKHYENEVEAIQELLKGKVTTAPKWHSGEGIFWTSKIADRISFTSYGYRLSIDNTINDFAIEALDKSERTIGTEVYFEISLHTKKSIEELFRSYSVDKSLAIESTSIPVKLYKEGDIWISRSQAKKILHGLEKYKKICLDFQGIKVIGQGFADEIFRVFSIHHPDIEIEAINMNDSVKLMVTSAKNDQTGRS